MLERILRSLALAKASWHVLMEDKKLLLFPLFSMIALATVIATFVAPVIWTLGYKPAVLAALGTGGHVPYATFFLSYLVCFFIVTFFNTALAMAAMAGFAGRSMSASQALRRTASKTPDLLVYSLISATIGTVIRAIEDHAEFAGAIVASIFGASWAVLTALAVPALAAEDIGPVTAIRRSAKALRKCWGETWVGGFGLSAIGALVIGAIVVIALLIMLVTPHAGLAIGFGAIGIAFVTWIMTTLDAIFRAAVYRHAMTGDDSHYDRDLLSRPRS